MRWFLTHEILLRVALVAILLGGVAAHGLGGQGSAVMAQGQGPAHHQTHEAQGAACVTVCVGALPAVVPDQPFARVAVWAQVLRPALVPLRRGQPHPPEDRPPIRV